MKRYGTKRQGWHEEPDRHAKARMGIKTAKPNRTFQSKGVKKSQFVSDCFKLRFKEGGEEFWKEMMYHKKEISSEEFSKRVDVSGVLDEDETFNDLLNEEDIKFYMSTVNGETVYFYQTAGFEFIFREDPTCPLNKSPEPEKEEMKSEGHTKETRVSDLVTKSKPVPSSSYYVIIHDRELSNWGPSEGKDNKKVLIAKNPSEARRIKKIAIADKDRKYNSTDVRITTKRPNFADKEVLYQYLPRSKYENWYSKGE